MSEQSEVARLLAQITNEYEASKQGLQGLAQGIGQHRFITKRMEQIAELHTQLRTLVGDEAMKLINEQLDDAIEGKNGSQEEPPPPTNQEIADMLAGLNRTASAWEASGDTTRAKKLGVDNYLKWFRENGIAIYEDLKTHTWKLGKGKHETNAIIH